MAKGAMVLTKVFWGCSYFHGKVAMNNEGCLMSRELRLIILSVMNGWVAVAAGFTAPQQKLVIIKMLPAPRLCHGVSEPAGGWLHFAHCKPLSVSISGMVAEF